MTTGRRSSESQLVGAIGIVVQLVLLSILNGVLKPGRDFFK